jgi:hypothetical protein
MDAGNLLPVELWTKIIQYLKPSQQKSAQQVCQLWWNIVQDIVAHGDLKIDYYVSQDTFVNKQLTNVNKQLTFVNKQLTFVNS